MSNGSIVVLTEDERIKHLIERSVEQEETTVVTVHTPTGLMAGMAKRDTSAVVVDLANRSVNGETLWSLAGVAELHHIPLIIVSRQMRPEVMSLARVVGARDVISTAESRQIIAGRMRYWMGDPPLSATA